MLPLPFVRMSSCRKIRTSQYPHGIEPQIQPMTTRANVVTLRQPALSRRDPVLIDPAIHDIPVEVVEERVDVRGAVGLIVEEVRVLVHVECDEGGCVPHRERVLRVADVIEETALVPVVRRPRPAAAGEPGRLQIGAPRLDGPEVALDERAERAGRLAAAPAEVLEVDLVVLDPADREGQVDLQRAEIGVHLVRRRKVDGRQLRENLVPLSHIALVELVVRLDRRPRDAVQLVHLGAKLARCDLLELERKGRHRAPLVPVTGDSGGSISSRLRRQRSERCRCNCPTCPTRTTRSSRISTRRRCGSTTTCITRRTSTMRTQHSKGPNGPTALSSRSSATSTRFPRTSRRPCETTPAAMRTTHSSGRS